MTATVLDALGRDATVEWFALLPWTDDLLPMVSCRYWPVSHVGACHRSHRTRHPTSAARFQYDRMRTV